MNSINITTSQNVTIKYELSTVTYRALAWLIDSITLWISSLLLLWILGSIFDSEGTLIFFVVLVPYILFFSLAFEYFNNGQSLGKMALKIRVIRIDGENATFLNYFMRWIFRVVDIYGCLGSIAALTILTSTNGQRIGDLLANTIVVSVDKKERLKLKSLLKLGALKDYKVKFPQVIGLSENDMLIVKETLDKNIKFNNYAHSSALNMLVDKLLEELEIEKKPKDKVLFLRTLLKDYVVLTR